MLPRTYVYVDGFNLFYGALKNTPYKWLDINKLCQLLLPGHDITQIKYFSAQVKPRPNKPDQGNNQAFYFRALRTLPNVEIILGHFLSSTVRMRVASPPPSTIKVVKTEEKGSDVNIAAHLVSDAYEKRFDVAVLITNDSDLATPIKIVKDRVGLPVGIINPSPRKFAHFLNTHATFKKRVRKGVLAASQFPPSLTDGQGTFRKPPSW